MTGTAETTFDDIRIAPSDAHLGMADTLLRFGAGVDRGEPSLLACVFTDDAVVDFRPCGTKLGLDFPLLQGAAAITAFLAGGASTHVTSHVISNTRAQLDGPAGRSRSLVDATHLVRADLGRHFRMMNWYKTEAVRSEAHWRIRSLMIDNVWFDGDPQILLVR